MRRLALLTAVGLLWLFLAALPALADGGPHVASVNTGVGGINADSCAGCHRAHTAEGAMLLNADDEEALCLTCHGAAGTGATTDVMTGVQYALGTGGAVRGTAQLGALRGGGFDQARIGSGAASRIATATGALRTKVPVVAAPQSVTSAHLEMTENGLSMPNIAWGNGPVSSTANPGPAVELSCASCHNPHGNGQYRILNPIPNPPANTGSVFTPVAAPGVTVTDAALPPTGDTRNYTVIAAPGPTYLLLASQVAGTSSPTDGDYFHRYVQWDTGVGYDAPNGQESTFNDQMITWCSACHSRYLASNFAAQNDAIYKRRHVTTDRQACTTCHVSHGSNAAMTGTYSATYPYPNNTAAAPSTSASSRLLKIDNRGTCQACHDPTGSIKPGDTTNPPPPTTTGTLSGTVTASGGGAISGATVSVSGGPTTTTNASGAYTLPGVATGTRSVTASATGYTASTLSVTIVVGSNTQNFSLTAAATPTGTLSGTVTASGGGAISGATVSVSGGPSTTTSATGAYTLPGVATGTRSVTASATGYTASTLSVTIVVGPNTQNFSLTAAATPTGTLEGTVTASGGGPISDASVTITGGRSTFTNLSGFYQFTGVTPGSYTVTASAAFYFPSSASGVAVSPGVTTTRNLTLALIP